jgi:hypothetical protein
VRDGHALASIPDKTIVMSSALGPFGFCGSCGAEVDIGGMIDDALSLSAEV